MKYTIQSDLKNYESALTIIAEGGEKYFEEGLEMIKKQRLYKQALKEYEKYPELQINVKRAFGDYLNQRGYT